MITPTSSCIATSDRLVWVLLLVFVALFLLLMVPLVVEVGSDALADGAWLAALYNATNGPSWNSGCRTNWNVANPGSVCSAPAWSGVTCNATGSGGVVNSVNLFDCNLQGGPLPEIVGAALTYCTTLELSKNKLNGSLPASFSDMSSLQYLYVWQNGLTGTLISSCSRMSSLQLLYLWSNSLSGSIPSSYSSMSSLQGLDLYNNSLTGTIPSSFSSLSSLRYLHLNSNNLTGTLPSSWYMLQPAGTGYYHLTSNYLTGDIPSSWLWSNATISGEYFMGNCLNVSNMTAVTATGRFLSGTPRDASVCDAFQAPMGRTRSRSPSV